MRDPENAPVEQRHVIAHAQHGLIDVPALELAVDDALQKLGGHLVGGVGIGETRLHHDSRRLGVDRWLQYLDARPEQVIAAIGEPDDAKRLAQVVAIRIDAVDPVAEIVVGRSEEHTSELQSLMRISYAVFCLKKKKK